MKIAVIGAGAAGSVFASYLKKGGADLYLVDRYREHMDRVAANGMIFVSPAGEEILTGFHTAYSPDKLETMDAVILMVKATQTDSVMPGLKNCIGSNTVVASLQNGLGNETILEKYIPGDQILYGFGTIGTELPCPGKCVSKPESGVIMRFGAKEKGGCAELVGRALEACFNRGGCETRLEPDIRPYVWKKAISNSGYNTLCAIAGMRVGDVLNSEAGIALIKSVWAEGCDVCRAVTGIDLWEELQEEIPRLKEGFAAYYPSMAQDVLIHHRRTEISVLNGAIARHGEKACVPVPVNTALTRLITCIQENYDRRYDIETETNKKEQ